MLNIDLISASNYADFGESTKSNVYEFPKIGTYEKNDPQYYLFESFAAEIYSQRDIKLRILMLSFSEFQNLYFYYCFMFFSLQVLYYVMRNRASKFHSFYSVKSS